MALALAAVLWAAVAAEQPTTQLIPVRLEIQTPPSQALLQDLPPIRALYAGSARELIKLAASSPPYISKVVPDTLTQQFFTIDLSPRDVTLASDADVVIQDVLPPRLVIALDEVMEQPVRIVPRISVRPASGYTLMGTSVSPDTVTVTGPAAQVERIGSVFTVPLELTDVRRPVTRSVAIDTSAFGIVRLSQYEIEFEARVEAVSELVLDGVPVVIAGGVWESMPTTVLVTIRGPESRLANLTPDSLVAVAPAAQVEGDMVPVTITLPRGLTAVISPDSVRAQRIIL